MSYIELFINPETVDNLKKQLKRDYIRSAVENSIVHRTSIIHNNTKCINYNISFRFRNIYTINNNISRFLNLYDL